MIRFTINAKLTAEPRPSQLTNETTRESIRRSLENPRMDPHMRESAELSLATLSPRTGVDADGQDYTFLRMEHEGRRLEISARGPLAHRVVAGMEVGETYRVSIELLGEEPHFRMSLRQWRRLGAEDRETQEASRV